MATPPFDIDQTLPGDSNIVSQHPPAARTFRDVTESWLKIDHDTSGEHDKVTLPERASDPSNAANKGFVYSKDVGGLTELFYEDSAGTVKQLTSAGSLLIGDGDVGTDQLAALAVTGAKIAANTITGNKIALGSDAQGDVMYYNGTDWVRLAASATVDWFLQSKGAGANPVWAAAGIFTESYESAEQTITAAGSLTLAHGLSAQPKLYTVSMKCQTGELGYSAGDEFQMTAFDDAGSGGRGIVIVPDGTNLNVRYGASGTIAILRKDNGTVASITFANWKTIFRAWA